MLNLSQSDEKVKTIYLAISFMIMFTAFDSLQTMMSNLYEQHGYKNLGQSAIMIIYVFAGISSLFSSASVRYLGQKNSLILGALGYLLFAASGLVVVQKDLVQQQFVRMTIYIGALACGLSSSVLWVAQGSYLSKISQPQTKVKVFALFWSIIMLNKIFASLISTFILGKIDPLFYFIVLISLASINLCLFCFLPKVQPSAEQSDKIIIKEELKKVWQIMTNKKYKYLCIYLFFPGISMAFSTGFLYKVIGQSFYQFPEQSIEDFRRRFNLHLGFVFMVNAVFILGLGKLLSKYGSKINTFKLITVGTFTAQMACLVTLLCYLLQSYSLCFVASVLWGSSQFILLTGTGAMIAQVFPGRIQGYTVFRILYNGGISAFFLTKIVMTDVNPILFFMIIIVIQTIATSVSFNLRYLQKTQ